MRRISRNLLATAIAVAVVATPAAALAAEATPTVSAPTAAGVEFFVQYAPQSSFDPVMAQLVVSAVVPETTSLPAIVRLPLPDAVVEIYWAGEVLDGSAEDPQREYVVEEDAGGHVLVMTIESGYVAQYEAFVGVADADDNIVAGTFTWQHTVDAATVSFGVLTPMGAEDLEISPLPVGDPGANSYGEYLYTLSPVNLEKGGSFTVEVSYAVGGGHGSSGAGDTARVAVIVLVALLVVAVIALVAVLAWQAGQRRARSAVDTPESTGSARRVQRSSERPSAAPPEEPRSRLAEQPDDDLDDLEW